MFYIAHRINEIEQLKKIPKNIGVEVDIRSMNGNLILQHDPFKMGEFFHDWLKFYEHAIIILNIKEEGLENKIIDLINKFKIKNYFFLDQSFPFLIKSAMAGQKKSAVRVSEFECINTAKNLANKVNWVWIDYFTSFPLLRNEVEELKKLGFKLCLVSPELQGFDPKIQIPKLAEFFHKSNIQLDAICTKSVGIWQNEMELT